MGFLRRLNSITMTSFADVVKELRKRSPVSFEEISLRLVRDRRMLALQNEPIQTQGDLL